MNAARDHSRFDELAVGSALYALEPGDEHALAEHLPTCSRCQQTLRESQESLAVLTAGLDGPMPPARVLDRIHEAIGAPSTGPAQSLPAVNDAIEAVPAVVARPAGRTDASGPKSARGPQARHRRGPGRGVRQSLRLRRISEFAAALVLVVALAVGVGSYNHLRTENRQQQAAAEQTRAAAEKLISDSSVATLADLKTHKTIAHVVNQNGKLEVVTDGLSANDATDSEYALWTITGKQAPKLVGTFDVKAADMDVQSVGSVPAGFDNVTDLAVSKEQGRGRPTQPDDVVGIGQVTS